MLPEALGGLKTPSPECGSSLYLPKLNLASLIRNSMFSIEVLLHSYYSIYCYMILNESAIKELGIGLMEQQYA